MAFKDLISINDLTAREVEKIFSLTEAIKARPLDFREALTGCSVALIFEKPSLRTRVTFDLGTTQMGASCVYLDHQGVRLGERESVTRGRPPGWACGWIWGATATSGRGAHRNR